MKVGAKGLEARIEILAESCRCKSDEGLADGTIPLFLGDALRVYSAWNVRGTYSAIHLKGRHVLAIHGHSSCLHCRRIASGLQK